MGSEAPWKLQSYISDSQFCLQFRTWTFWICGSHSALQMPMSDASTHLPSRYSPLISKLIGYCWNYLILHYVEQSSAALQRPEMALHTYFQVTVEKLSVPHLMCWQMEVTVTTTRCCWVISVIMTMHVNSRLTLITYGNTEVRMSIMRNNPVLRAFCAGVCGVFIWFHIFTIVKARWRDPRPENFHLFQSGSLELTSTDSSWHVTITDSVLRTTKIHCVLLSTMIHSHSASVTV